MKTIRLGIFETNSSSTHSITLCSKEDFTDWCHGFLLYSNNSGKLLTRQQAVEELKNDEWFNQQHPNYDFTQSPYRSDLSDKLVGNGYEDHGNYSDDDELEFFSQEFTTKSGEDIIVFGKYGYNG